MSLPPINPPKSAAGISVDPTTLQRIVAPTKRADGSVRKELKIRPGFTPQEDVAIFRTARQAVIDSRKPGAPGRVIPGWAPPEDDGRPKPKPKEPKPPKVAGANGVKKGQQKDGSKSVVKGKGKAKAPEVEPVKDSWDDEDEDDSAVKKDGAVEAEKKGTEDQEQKDSSVQAEQDIPALASTTDPVEEVTDALKDVKV